VKAITDASSLLTHENAETLLVAPALIVCVVPLLSAWAWISKREQENPQKQFCASHDSALWGCRGAAARLWDHLGGSA
jgi:hypothetical protein